MLCPGRFILVESVCSKALFITILKVFLVTFLCQIWYQFKEQVFIFQMSPLALEYVKKCASEMDLKIFENLEKARKLPRL